MLSEYNLKTLWIPSNQIRRIGALNLTNFDYDNKTPQSDIYVSSNFLEKNKKLLCLIQGTGNVRAG